MTKEINFTALFVTVFSHVTLLPTFPVMLSKKLLFEVSVAGFGLLCSVMYHVCQSIYRPIILSESQWHKLDNIGVISLIGLLFVNLSCINDRVVEKVVKYVVFFASVASQEPHPWDVRFTAAPILIFSLIPIVHLLIIKRQLPAVNKKQLYLGLLSLVLSTVFFVLGLDDDSDTQRIIHGMWHFLVGIASYFLWRVIKTPSITSSLSAVVHKCFIMDDKQSVSVYNDAISKYQRGLLSDAIKAINNFHPRTFVFGWVRCIDLLATIACQSLNHEHINCLFNALKDVRRKLNQNFPDCERGTEEVVKVLLENVRKMLAVATTNIKEALENPSSSDEEFTIITGIPLELRVKERYLNPCFPIINRLATEFFNCGNYGSFIRTTKDILRVYNASALSFISICEEFELDKILDRVADSIARTVQKVFLDPISSYPNTRNEIEVSRRDFFASTSSGEELIAMLSQLSNKLAQRGCWKNLWTIVTCIHQVSKGFSDFIPISVAAFHSNAKTFWICKRYDFHAYCLSRAAQLDHQKFATKAAVAALCTHNDDKEYDPFEASTGYNVNAVISGVFDDPSTDNESLLSRLLVPGIMASMNPEVLKLVHSLRSSNASVDYQLLNQQVSKVVESVPEVAQYASLLSETILRRQVEDIAQRKNLVELSHLQMKHSTGVTEKEYVDFVEPVILQETGVPVDIDCKTQSISFRNAARKKLQSYFTKLASMVSVKPAAATVEVKQSQGLPHLLPVETPSITLDDLVNAEERGKAFYRLQAACRKTKEARKEQRRQEIEDEKEQQREERRQRERQKEEQRRKENEEVRQREKQEQSRQQGLLKVIKILREKYPGVQLPDALSTKKNAVFEDEVTKILADFKRKKEELSQKETLTQDLFERALRRLEIPKRKELNLLNAEVHKLERKNVRENFLVEHRREYEKRKKEREVLKSFLKDAEIFERDVIQKSGTEKSSKRDEQQSLLEQEMRRLEKL